jgi:hypothetical protein
MIRKNIFILLFCVAAFFSCSKIDNYQAPNGGIYGKLTDLMTNEGIQTEQPNGYNIKMFEKGWSMSTPITFGGKVDGTFENALVFQSNYKILPVDGPFFPIIDTASVQVGSRTEVNFNVMPFVSVTNVTATPGANKVTLVYSIVRSQPLPAYATAWPKITTRKSFLSKVSVCNNTTNNLSASTSTTAITDATLLTTTFTDVITGTTAIPLVSGTTYWVRVGVLASGSGYNSLNRYNYGKTIQITMP